jgi:hypothetical protein
MKNLLLFGAIALSITAFGQDVKTFKIGKLEVMTEDLVEMDWDEAVKACADLGDGWRLPTRDELNVLYKNKDKIGGFTNYYGYWSSTEHGIDAVWRHFFDDGNQYGGSKSVAGSVRAVRTF